MSQLQHVIEVLPRPGAEVEGVAGVVRDYQAVQLCGTAAHDVQGLHEGGDVTPSVSWHDGHVGPEFWRGAYLLLVQDNDGILILVIPTQTSGYESNVLINGSTVP